jgi:hypothetical protein
MGDSAYTGTATRDARWTASSAHGEMQESMILAAWDGSLAWMRPVLARRSGQQVRQLERSRPYCSARSKLAVILFYLSHYLSGRKDSK